MTSHESGGRSVPRLTGIPMPLASGLTAAQALSVIVGAWKDYAELKAEQVTERRKIESWERVELTRIKSNEEIFLKYIDQAFAERAAGFRGLFATLDQARADGDAQTIGPAIQAIVDLARASPLAGLLDLAQVRKQLVDPGHVWEM